MRDQEFRELRWALLRGGVAPKHVTRMLKELGHHYDELHAKGIAAGLSAEEASIQAQEALGSPKLIVDEAIAKPELHSWAYRWPWLIYGAAPLLAPILVTVLLGVLTILVVDSDFVSSHAETRPIPIWISGPLEVTRIFLMYVLPTLLGVIWLNHAARRGAPLLWPSIAITVIALVGCGININVDLPTEIGEMGQIGGGWGYVGRRWDEHLIRFSVTVAIVLGPYLAWRSRLRLQSKI